MREIVLDTETTGLDPLKGDRIVEIGCVETINYVSTQKTYHAYFNPEKPMPEEASRVHGLTDDFLADKPVFAAAVDAFLSFIGDDPLIIHNAPFDIGFLNAELGRLGFRPLATSRVVDTLPMARRAFPGAPASLDALCKRFGIDSSSRTFHGALLDAQLLAEVYLELRGGRQPGLSMERDAAIVVEEAIRKDRPARQAREQKISAEEEAAHNAFLEKIKNALWKQ